MSYYNLFWLFVNLILLLSTFIHGKALSIYFKFQTFPIYPPPPLIRCVGAFLFYYLPSLFVPSFSGLVFDLIANEC